MNRVIKRFYCIWRPPIRVVQFLGPALFEDAEVFDLLKRLQS